MKLAEQAGEQRGARRQGGCPRRKPTEAHYTIRR